MPLCIVEGKTIESSSSSSSSPQSTGTGGGLGSLDAEEFIEEEDEEHSNNKEEEDDYAMESYGADPDHDEDQLGESTLSVSLDFHHMMSTVAPTPLVHPPSTKSQGTASTSGSGSSSFKDKKTSNSNSSSNSSSATAVVTSSLPLLPSTTQNQTSAIIRSRSSDSLPSVTADSASVISQGSYSHHSRVTEGGHLVPIARKVHTLAPLPDVLPSSIHSGFPRSNLTTIADETRHMNNPATTMTQNQQCTFCLKRYPINEISAHIKTCDLRKEECPNMCGKKILFLKMHQHLKECTTSSNNN